MLDIVRAGGLAGFESLVRSLGGSPSVILRRVGLGIDDLADPDRYLPYRNVLLAIEEAATELKSPDFGLRLSAVQACAGCPSTSIAPRGPSNPGS
ncbi:AraC family transcriptional regulator ligand-binding domain-containing protein [Variovorax sp. J22R24]|uniref:AraC family transcriptional regulator ligand-binding domain-containing protein n=1 Tax=Variovorax gracilis TaxID=3053502 RepID=UPI002574CE47|nr:AraC family transcriptional regulator ligand-binding domain-containing protein [Variovorax sp. J22R24]MDM0108592.1 AraC family transcriptional regulator ligand-binding domain-containing protein [Variovorax sp. J22R24]